MSILPRRGAVQALRPHDPLTCGLDPDTDCDQCRAARLVELPPPNPRDTALAQWERLRGDHWRLLRECPAEPGSPPAELVGQLVWALLSPDTQALLRTALLDLLADSITDIAVAAVQEVISDE